MTNYNERLDKIFAPLIDSPSLTLTTAYWDEAKAAITSLIKELVEEAKPAMAIISDEEMGIDRARELEESLYNIFIKNTDGATTTKQQKEPEKNTVPTTDYTISLNKNALIDNFLIQAYALENYFKIDILDELNSIANKISEVDNE